MLGGEIVIGLLEVAIPKETSICAQGAWMGGFKNKVGRIGDHDLLTSGVASP